MIKMSPPLLRLPRACNNEVHQMTVDYPERFAGLATLPMQDVKAAIAELERPWFNWVP